MTPGTAALLRCPVCAGTIDATAAEARCRGACGRVYPVVDGVPVLLDESRSIFRIADFVDRKPAFFGAHGKLFRMLEAIVPRASVRPKTRRNFKLLRERLLAESPQPRVLVIGGSIAGYGFDALEGAPLELVETDVAHGPRTALICDAHCLPFADGSFDAVIAQCVLQHVVDPYRCVDELHRVLRPGGWVYAETAFLQQVQRPWDFHHFTLLGHRRLFRAFTEVESGASAGPATVLAWSYENLLLSFVSGRTARYLVKAFARFSSFFLKYLDYALIDRPSAPDAASAIYFLGTRAERALRDDELLPLYRGAARA